MPRRRHLNKKYRLRLSSLLLILLGIIIIVTGVVIFLSDVKEENSGKIAVIPVYGEISLLGNGASSKNLVPLITKANNDNSVKAIIIDIDSSGGSFVASKEIANAVGNCNKPVVALIRETAASGAYWIASEGDVVVADQASITGSISVTASYLQFAGTMDKYGVAYEQVVSGEYKNMGSPFKELTYAEKKILEGKVNILNNMFIDAIAQNRNLERDYVAKLATGEIYLGVEAKNYGLIDVFGDKLKAQHVAEELAGLDKSELIEYKSTATFSDLLSQRVQSIAQDVGASISNTMSGLKLRAD